MISTVSFNLNHTDLKENAPISLKSKSGGAGAATPGLAKQKSVLTNSSTPRGAFRDLTNASVTPQQLSSKSKNNIILTTTPTSKPKVPTTHPNLLFVPSSTPTNTQLKKLNNSTPSVKLIEKKKLVSPVSHVVVREKPVEAVECESAPRIDVMYPAPKIPLHIENRLSNQQITSMIMAPASNNLGTHSNDTSTLYDNSYDDIDFTNYDNSKVPDFFDGNTHGPDDLQEPPPSPLLTNESTANSNSFSFTDYFNQILL